jgi:hypothetical protein
MKWLFLIGFLFVSVQLSAQEAFVVTGDDLTTGFGTVNYSVGQLIVKSDSTKNGTMRHGIQIPIELFKIPVGIDDIKGGILEKHQMNSNEMLLSLMQRSVGTYTIVISQQSKTVSSFSIIKH